MSSARIVLAERFVPYALFLCIFFEIIAHRAEQICRLVKAPGWRIVLKGKKTDIDFLK